MWRTSNIHSNPPPLNVFMKLGKNGCVLQPRSADLFIVSQALYPTQFTIFICNFAMSSWRGWRGLDCYGDMKKENVCNHKSVCLENCEPVAPQTTSVTSAPHGTGPNQQQCFGSTPFQNKTIPSHLCVPLTRRHKTAILIREIKYESGCYSHKTWTTAFLWGWGLRS